MGIKYLTKFIDESVNECTFTDRVEAGSTLVVDGSGFVFHIVSTLKRRQREERWLKLFDFYTNRSKCDVLELPTPPMVMSQLLHYLNHFRIPMVKCDGEADSAIASKCKELNASGTPAYCYGQDRYIDHFFDYVVNIILNSDFMIMQDAPYIAFGSLTRKHDTIDGISTKVWRRAAIAKQLGLTEDQLVELAILVGNDLSSPFKRSLFIDVPDDMDETMYASKDNNIVQRSLKFILQRDLDYKLTSNNKELQQIIQFSRAFYNLTDISIYPEDPEIDCDSSDYIGINSYKKNGIRIFCDAYKRVGNDTLTTNLNLVYYYDDKNSVISDVSEREVPVPYLALQYLWSSQSDKSNSMTYLNKERLVALHKMGQELFRKFLITRMKKNYFTSSGGGEDTFDIVNCLKSRSGQESWEDVLVTNEYQLVCKEIVRVLQSDQDDYKKEDDKSSSTFRMESYEVDIVSMGSIYNVFAMCMLVVWCV